MHENSSPRKIKIDPDKNIPKLDYGYSSSKFYVETESDLPQLPSLGHFEIMADFCKKWLIFEKF